MYRIVGADQKEYGPISADQIRQWISEGRANAQTLARFEDGPWKPLASFPEFAASLPAGPPPPLVGASVPLAGGPPRNNGMAIAGLIFGVLGMLQCCTPVFALLGILFSCLGLYQINRNPTQESGKALAIAGIVTATLGLFLFGGLFFTGALHEMTRQLRHILR